MSKIISVSRRTDIPAFYGDWFINRLNEGYVCYRNPIQGQKITVSLKPEDVACLVFWSKNYKPFMRHLPAINERGYNAMFHFTITGLPNVFETNLIERNNAIETLQVLSKMYSPAQITWRYDPIIISDITDREFHLKNFAEIASRLQGYVTNCQFSFANLGYRKVKRNVERYKTEKAIIISDPDIEFKIDLAHQLAEIAASFGITMYSCCGEFLVGGKILKARCVNGDLMNSLFGLDLKTPKISLRKECRCAQNVDIGAYDTCPHGCMYCYATNNSDKARACYENHDVRSPCLGDSTAKIAEAA